MKDLIDVLTKFRKLLNKSQKFKIIIIIVMMIIGAFLEVIGVSLIVPLISIILDKDFFVTNKYVVFVSEKLCIRSADKLIIFMLIALALIYIIKNIFLFIEYYVQIRFIRNNKLNARVKSMWKYLNKPYEFYFHAKPGELLRETSTDITNTYNMLLELLTLGTEAVMVIFLITMVFIIDSIMAILVSLILLVELLIIYKKIKPVLSKAGNEWNISVANSNKWMLQSFDGIKEIKVGKKEVFFLKKFEIYATCSSNSEMISSIFSLVPRLLIEAITIAFILLVVAGMVFWGGDIGIILPKLSAFAVASAKFLPSVNRISTSLNSLMYNKASLDNVSKMHLLNEIDIKIDYEYKKKTKLEINKAIELKDITYIYPGTDKIILKNANMLIPAGAMVGVVGTSGSGKTTSIDLLLGLLKGQVGDVLVDGRSIYNNREEFLENVSYIPQQIFMLNGTIRENVAFGIEDQYIDDDKVWQSLSEAEMKEFVKNLPEGLETEIGEKGIRLSGGQKQRIGIARALYNEPQILVFDEATSALDNETESAIMESINNMHGKKTIIIIAHRLTTIENCDIVYRVENGIIIKENTNL